MRQSLKLPVPIHASGREWQKTLLVVHHVSAGTLFRFRCPIVLCNCYFRLPLINSSFRTQLAGGKSLLVTTMGLRFTIELGEARLSATGPPGKAERVPSKVPF